MRILRRVLEKSLSFKYVETKKLYKSRKEKRQVHIHSIVDWINACSNDCKEWNESSTVKNGVYRKNAKSGLINV